MGELALLKYTPYRVRKYRPLQRHPSTGHSWYVDRDGAEMSGTWTAPGRPVSSVRRMGYYHIRQP